MWTVLDDEMAGSLDELCGAGSGGGNGQNTVGIAVDNKRGYIDALQIAAKIFMPGGNAGKAGGGRSRGRYIPARLHGLLAHTLTQVYIRVVKVHEELSEEGVAIGGNCFLDSGKHAAIHTVRIVACLQQVRRHTGDDDGFAYSLRAVLTDIASDFATTHREANQGEVAQLQMSDELVQIFCECVVVVACRRLAGFAKSPAIIGDDSITGL